MFGGDWLMSMNCLLAVLPWDGTLKIICIVLASASLAIVSVYLIYTVVKMVRQSQIPVQAEFQNADSESADFSEYIPAVCTEEADQSADSAAVYNDLAIEEIADTAGFAGRRKTLADRLDASDEETRGYFERLRAFLSEYPAISVLTGKLYLTYRYKKRAIVKMTVHGKSVLLYFALNPSDYEGTKYHFEDKSSVKAFEHFPAEFKVRSERSFKYAEDLLHVVFENTQVPSADQ